MTSSLLETSIFQVQVLGVCLDEPYLMVLEYLENGDLKSFLQKRSKDHTISFDKLLLICEEVSHA